MFAMSGSSHAVVKADVTDSKINGMSEDTLQKTMVLRHNAYIIHATPFRSADYPRTPHLQITVEHPATNRVVTPEIHVAGIANQFLLLPDGCVALHYINIGGGGSFMFLNPEQILRNQGTWRGYCASRIPGGNAITVANQYFVVAQTTRIARYNIHELMNPDVQPTHTSNFFLTNHNFRPKALLDLSNNFIACSIQSQIEIHDLEHRKFVKALGVLTQDVTIKMMALLENGNIAVLQNDLESKDNRLVIYNPRHVIYDPLYVHPPLRSTLIDSSVVIRTPEDLVANIKDTAQLVARGMRQAGLFSILPKDIGHIITAYAADFDAKQEVKSGDMIMRHEYNTVNDNDDEAKEDARCRRILRRCIL